MKLRDWLKSSNVSIKSFAEQLDVERAMVYRYFIGTMPRPKTIRRVELITDGAVTAQDFYDNAVHYGYGNRMQPSERGLSVSAQEAVSAATALPRETPAPARTTSRHCARVSVSRAIPWPDLSDQNIPERVVQTSSRTNLLNHLADSGPSRRIGPAQS